jgi:hypothetical protein
MINSRGTTVIVIWLACVIALFFCFGVDHAPAAEAPISAYCQQIREIVSSIGVKDAEKAARAAGASEQQIAEAKKCLRLR